MSGTRGGRRAEIRTYIHQASSVLLEMLDIMGGTSDEMWGARERVRLAAEEALEPMAVIGAEGHGKSTLVDVIVGADVVPREEQDPGTVAPVLLRWGPEREPHYSVLLEGGDGREPVAGVTEFRELLTQKLNPHNHKGVRKGYVEWQHEALAGGMSLLDVPGLAGVSATVAAQLERHMAEVRKVILLVRDRRYAHAAEALRRFGHLRVDAVVCNWDAAMFDQGDVAAKVADQPTALHLNVGIDVDPAQVFVLHLPSLEQWGTRRRRVEHPVHDTEVTRFWHWVGDTASPLAADRLLAAWASAIEEAVELLDAHYADRSGILIEDSQSDEESERRIGLLVDASMAAADAFDSLYDRLLEESGFEQRAAEEFAALRKRSKPVREELAGAAAQGRKRRSSLVWWNDPHTLAVTKEIFDQPFARAGALEQAAQESIGRLMAFWRGTLEPVLQRVASEHLPFVYLPLDSVNVRGPDFPVERHDAGSMSLLGYFDRRQDFDRACAAAAGMVLQLGDGPSGQLTAFWNEAVEAVKQGFRTIGRDHFERISDAVIEQQEVVTESRRLAQEGFEEVRRRLGDV